MIKYLNDSYVRVADHPAKHKVLACLANDRFLHGGKIIGGSTNAGLDDIYVLSLPAFRWFHGNQISGQGRPGHTCHATGSGQMIFIGGVGNSQYIADIR